MIDDCENLGKRRVRFARQLLTRKRQTGNCIPRVSLPPRPPAGVNNWMIRPDNSPCANVDRSKTVAVAGCLFVMSVCVDACWAGDWPGWLGPQRNGRSSETIAAWKAEPQTVWKQPVGNGYSSPIAWEGLVFVHSAVKGQDSELVQAFDAVTGKRVWDDTYSRETYRSELGTGPRATPTVHNGRLYTMGITGILSCYDAKTGNRIWRVNPYSELNASRPGFGVCSSPLVVADRVVLPVGGAGSGVVAYHAETGELAWKACDEPAAAASPVMVSRPNAGGEGTRVEVVVQTTLRLLGMNPSDGTSAGLSAVWRLPHAPGGWQPARLLDARHGDTDPEATNRCNQPTRVDVVEAGHRKLFFHRDDSSGRSGLHRDECTRPVAESQFAGNRCQDREPPLGAERARLLSPWPDSVVRRKTPDSGRCR